MYTDVFYYSDDAGVAPFQGWFDKLDKRSRYIVNEYIQRVTCGGSRKNVKRIKNGDEIFEIVIDRGAGFRIYFAVDKTAMIILLGGIKRNQKLDIRKAQKYWRHDNERTKILREAYRTAHGRP